MDSLPAASCINYAGLGVCFQNLFCHTPQVKLFSALRSRHRMQGNLRVHLQITELG